MKRENENENEYTDGTAKRGDEVELRGEPELEARLVAWVAGEISEHEQKELERLAKARPELARFKERIELVRELVQEAARPDAAPLRLSPERRAKLLQTLGADAEVLPLREQVVVLPPKRAWWRGRRGWEYFAGVGMAAGLTVAVIHVSLQPRVFEERAELHVPRPDAAAVLQVQQVVDTVVRSEGGVDLARVAYAPAPAARAVEVKTTRQDGAQRQLGSVEARAALRGIETARVTFEVAQAPRFNETLGNDGATPMSAAPARGLSVGGSIAGAGSGGDVRAIEMLTLGKAVDDLAARSGARRESTFGGRETGSAGAKNFPAPVPPSGGRATKVAYNTAAVPADTALALAPLTPRAEPGETLFGPAGNVRLGAVAQAPTTVTFEVPQVAGLADQAPAIAPPPPAQRVFLGTATGGTIALGPAGTISGGGRESEMVQPGTSASGTISFADRSEPSSDRVGTSFAATAGAVVRPAPAEADERGLKLDTFSLSAPEKKVALAVGPQEGRARRAAGGGGGSATGEVSAATEAVSTFSLHVSDVSWRLMQAAVAAAARGEERELPKVRAEEIYNAFDYGDPWPTEREKVTARIEQAAHPVLQERNLVRIALRVAATGRANSQPLRLTVVLDTSGSMEREDRRTAVRRALTELVALLRAEDRVTLIGFARQPRLLAESVAGDKAAELVTLALNTPPDGGTNLEEALKLAGEVALRHRADGAQNRIVLLTDGAANLGDAEPARLMAMVEALRGRGLAFDACGVGLEGAGDAVLEALTRKGDGRYHVLDRAEAADATFAKKLAGAFRPAAENVKVQVRFNPARVGSYRLIGFDNHRLQAEDFRNDAVDAAELAAEEAAVAMYQIEARPQGTGDLGEVAVRFRDPATGEMVERSWVMPYEAQAPVLRRASASMQLAGVAAMLAEGLAKTPVGEAVQLRELAPVVGQLRGHFPEQGRVRELVEVFEQLRRMNRE